MFGSVVGYYLANKKILKNTNAMRLLIKPIVVGMMILFSTTLQAQVSINVNLGAAPVWIPQVQTGVRYYYLSDVDAYYDMNSSMFIVSNNGNWIHRRHLPERYRSYNLYNGRKVAVRNYCGNSPYAYSNYHKHNKWDRDNYDRLAQRVDRENDRYNDHNERGIREQHDWKNDGDRREEGNKFRNDNERKNNHR